MKKMFMAFFLIALCVPLLSFGQTPDNTPSINVAISDGEPFVFHNSNNELTGFDIDLWKAIASEMGVKTNFVTVKTFPELLDMVKNGSVDAAISSISITSAREEIMDFSTPYFNSGLMIMVKEDTKAGFFGSCLNFIVTEIPRDIASNIIALIFFVVIFALLMSLYLHLDNSKNSGNLIDRKPWLRNSIGIIATIILAIVCIITISKMSSSMTADKFLYSISMPKDLRGKNVATVAGTTSIAALQEFGANISTVTDIDDAYVMLDAGQVDAIVYDAPTLQYYAKTRGAGKFAAVGSMFDQQYYGIAVPQGSHIREYISKAILKMKENGVYDKIYKQYFGVD